MDALYHSVLAPMCEGAPPARVAAALPSALPLLARCVTSLCRFGDAALAAGQCNGVGSGGRGGGDVARAARARAALDAEATHSLLPTTAPLAKVTPEVTPAGNLRVNVPGLGFPSVVAPTPAHAA